MRLQLRHYFSSRLPFEPFYNPSHLLYCFLQRCACLFTAGLTATSSIPRSARVLHLIASAHHRGVRRRLVPFGMTWVAALVIALTSVNSSSSRLRYCRTAFLFSSWLTNSLYFSQSAFLTLHRGSFLSSTGAVLMVMLQAWCSEKGLSAASQIEYGSHLLGTAAISIAHCVPVERSVRVGTPSTLSRT